MITRFIIFCVILFQCQESVFAQWTKNIAVQPQLMYGKIFKHSPKILFPIPTSSYGATVNITYKTFGKQYWNAWENYPELGVQLGYFNLGNAQILGNAFSILPNVSLKLGGGDRTRFDMLVGSGLAYLTKKFDYNTNPLQTAIGSHLNNITVLQFNFHKNISPTMVAIAGAGLTHYSNGASKLPNLGINILTTQIGLQWTPNAVPRNEYLKTEIDPNPTKKWGFTTNLGLAFVEQSLPGGPKYPIYIASIGAIYRLSKVQQLSFGLETEYNTSDYYFLLRSTEAKTEAEASKAATRFLIYGADEFFFWPFSMVLQAGTYLDSDYDFKFGKIYTKLSMRYYFPPIGHPNTRLFAAIHLKAHKLAAEYISFGFGAML